MTKKTLSEARSANQNALNWLNAQDFALLPDNLSQAEQSQRAKAAEMFWKIYFEPVLKRLTAEQIGKNLPVMETAEQLLWLRGMINFSDIIKDWFVLQVAQSQQKEQDFNLEN